MLQIRKGLYTFVPLPLRADKNSSASLVMLSSYITLHPAMFCDHHGERKQSDLSLLLISEFHSLPPSGTPVRIGQQSLLVSKMGQDTDLLQKQLYSVREDVRPSETAALSSTTRKQTAHTKNPNCFQQDKKPNFSRGQPVL